MRAWTLFSPRGSLMHTYLILAHKNLDQLPRLVDRLDTGSASFFLQLDKNTDAAAYEREIRELSQIPNVRWVERQRSSRATFGVVQAQRAWIDAALGTGAPFTHLTLLTGQDYPLKPPKRNRCVLRHAPRDFLHPTQSRKTKEQKRKLQRYRYKTWYLHF